ncbi:MAG: TetR/AcrR family transcriptional regulator [Acidimicrobiia bacterium]
MSWLDRVVDRSDTAQRSQARRVKQAEEIVAAAERLLLATGEAFTIQELVAEAGIALQTFYRYFPTKDELMLAVLESGITRSCAEIQRVVDTIDDPVEQLRYLVTSPLRWLSNGDYGRGRIVTQEHFRLHQISPEGVAIATQPFADLLLGVLRRGQAAGVFHPIDPERDAALINELTASTYHHYSFTELGNDADAIIDHFWRFCLMAVGGDASMAKVDDPKPSSRAAIKTKARPGAPSPRTTKTAARTRQSGTRRAPKA